MKKANIYKVTIKEDNRSPKHIYCVATDINNVVEIVAPRSWNNETKEYYYNKYKESDIIGIILEETDVLVQNYINDIID